MNRMLLLASAAVLATSAVIPASAQDSTAPTQASGAQRGGDEITCREISTMDTATVQGVLYYISGYNVGREEGMAGATGGTASNTTGTTTSGSDASSGTTTQSGSTASGSTGSTASTDTGTAGDTTASTSNAPAADASGSGSSTTAENSAAGSSSGTSAVPNPQVSMIRGYFDIPVEKIVVACQNAPDSRASDMIKQESGSGSNGASSN